MNKRNYMILCITPDECSLIADAIQAVIDADELMLSDGDLIFLEDSLNSEIKALENLKKRFI